MSKPNAADVCRTALELAARVPPIPYVMSGETERGMDCQGLVEFCVRANGGTMNFSGSNDMIRRACTGIYTVSEARGRGLIAPGWLVYILKQDGREPDKYKGDGVGNASHVGLYVGQTGAETVHASYSKGIVCPTLLANGWTHCGPAKAIEYAAGATEPDPLDDDTPYSATVDTGDSLKGLNFRMTPSARAAKVPGCEEIPKGATVTVLEHVNSAWARVNYNGFGGYAMRQYLRESKPPDAGDGETVTVRVDELAAARRTLAELDGAISGWMGADVE